jgi:pilus assembly protein CpaF
MSDVAERLAELRRSARAEAAPAPVAAAPVPAGQDFEIWDAGAEAVRAELYEVRRRLHARVAEELGTALYQDLPPEKLSALVRTNLTKLLAEESTPMSAEERKMLLKDIESDVLGHGPIEDLLKDADVTEVMVNGPFEIYIERAGKIYKTKKRFADAQHLRGIIDGIVTRIGRRIDESSPMVDARLPDGSRVNAVIAPIAIEGPFLTVRKFSEEPLTDGDLIRFGTFSRQTADFLELCVVGKLNMLITGGTGTGKTSTLNVLSSYIPSDERIVTVEDAVELRLNQPHVLQLESRPRNIEGKGEITIRDLVRNSLRMRPDRIVVGEVRGAEALDMLQAMNTGHEGSISTLHANSPRNALSRLETMVLMAGTELPARAIREQIASAVDIILHLTRLRDGSRKITHITEVEGMEGDVITAQDIFEFDFSAGINEAGRFMGRLKATGVRPKFIERLADYGIRMSPDTFVDPEVMTHQDGGKG